MSYIESVIAHAAKKAETRRPMTDDMFVTILTGGKYGTSIEPHDTLDDAAHDAKDHHNLGRYYATLRILPDGSTQWLDLRDRREDLEQEEEAEHRAEQRYVNGLMCGAGRVVL